ncbi:MAG: DUF2442 domain-containing protein [Chloroflexota bacterium]
MISPKTSVKTFKLRYPLSDYTFPKEVKIASVRFDETYMHVTLTDERILSIPLKWIPTLYHAKPAEREKYKINQTKRMLVWDPSECEINEELRVEDYLGPVTAEAEMVDIPKTVREKKATYKTAKKKK